ncbi:unnamed protein product [Allacma fusca]|uniref:Uncharacterized protein n=1 Tax=Allacma fusca TaxID=39272 RepID=A0A8J2KH02_9HEXA|nr:unnamed protein product [Allacma fusca]
MCLPGYVAVGEVANVQLAPHNIYGLFYLYCWLFCRGGTDQLGRSPAASPNHFANMFIFWINTGKSLSSV